MVWHIALHQTKISFVQFIYLKISKMLTPLYCPYTTRGNGSIICVDKKMFLETVSSKANN